MRALFTLTPTESKRLIAKGTVKFEAVQNAKREGLIVISWGSTCAYVAEELLRGDIRKEKYIAGLIICGVTCETPPKERPPIIVLEKGKPIELPFKEALSRFTAGDVYIKGANAIDSSGVTGVLMTSRFGGTIGTAIGFVVSSGAKLVVPIGLEKMIPSVPEAARHCGIDTIEYSIGSAPGLMPIMNAEVITEARALNILACVKAIPIASGGQAGSQGSVVIVVEGDKEDVEKALKIVNSIKGEKPLDARKRDCETCHNNCTFKGLKADSLPPYLRG